MDGLYPLKVEEPHDYGHGLPALFNEVSNKIVQVLAIFKNLLPKVLERDSCCFLKFTR